jgi:hypothetical protein
MNPSPSAPDTGPLVGGEATPPVAHGWSLGLIFMALGCLAFVLARRIPYSELGGNQDPGPRAFPTWLGLLLIAGGALEFGAWWRNRRRPDRAPMQPEPGISSESGELPGRNLDVVILAVAVALYVPALVGLGFSLSTCLFTAVMMRRLGAGWPAIVGTAVGLVILVQVLFVRLFQVQLPAGMLGLPF